MRMRLVSVYQPSWSADREGLERCWQEMERQVKMGGREKLIIRGNLNASVGANQSRAGISGMYMLGSWNEAGRDLLDWCWEQGLPYVNSFVRHAERGAWFNRARGACIELDGFLVRSRDRGGAWCWELELYRKGLFRTTSRRWWWWEWGGESRGWREWRR